MFKAQIITDINGKKTVLEFDDQKEYVDYLSNHPELNIQSSFDQNFAKQFAGRSLPSRNPWSEMERIVDHSVNRHLSHTHSEHSNPFALVKQDMRRMEEDEKREKIESEKKERARKQQEKELEEAKQLLAEYKLKTSHNPEYAKKLQEHIEKLEKELKQ